MKNSIKLLEDLDKLLSKMGDDYGPAVLDELKYRIDKTITDFNAEVSSLLHTSFKENKKTYKEFVKFKNKESEEDKSEKMNDKEADVPSFIKGHNASKK